MSSINYDLIKIKGFAFDVDGVLSPSTVPLGEDGYPRRMANIKDGYALHLAAKLGYRIAIITGGRATVIRSSFELLGIKDIYTDVGRKLPVLQNWLDRHGLTGEEVLYMGDDIPDLPCLRFVGLSCAPFDAAWEVKESARYISKFSGGYGCVRDVVEQVMKAQGNWMAGKEAFEW